MFDRNKASIGVKFLLICGIVGLMFPGINPVYAIDRTVSVSGVGENVVTSTVETSGTNGTSLNALGNFELQFNPNVTYRSDETNGIENITVNSSAISNMTFNYSFISSVENVTFFKNGSVRNDTGDDLSGFVTGALFSEINNTHSISSDNSTALNWTVRNQFEYYNVNVTIFTTDLIRVVYTVTATRNGSISLTLTGLRKLQKWNHSINGTTDVEIESNNLGIMTVVLNDNDGIHTFARETDELSNLQVFFDFIRVVLIQIFVVVLVVNIVFIIIDSINSQIGKSLK